MQHEKFNRSALRTRMIILDVDGVLTDGSITLDNEGNEFKSFHVRDGHAIKLAQQAGLVVAVITGRTSRVVERRMKELGIGEVHQGARDKHEVYRALLRKYGVSDEEVACMGDDVVDVPLLESVGLPAVPADADSESTAMAIFISDKPGGRGAVRDLIEKILRAQGVWDSLVRHIA
ncbi:MAG: HAD-IIIA family hydrolase [Nitrospirae bacterium]|nr:HAD-IIIA family hydrolase [Nitrospirota bacterium]